MKYLVFFFNFIFWLCGLALIVVGIMVQLALHNTVMVKDASASGAPILIIALGVLIFIIAFFGCCGAWKENYCMITMFAILMSLTLIAQIAAVILGYVFRGKINSVVEDSLADMISLYNTSSADFRATVDKLQQDLKCCGFNSSADWKSFTPSGDTVPDSCCITVVPNCGQDSMMNATKVYQQGCNVALETLLKDNIQWVIAATLIIAALEVLGVVFACLLMRGIRSGYEVM